MVICAVLREGVLNRATLKSIENVASVGQAGPLAGLICSICNRFYHGPWQNRILPVQITSLTPLNSRLDLSLTFWGTAGGGVIITAEARQQIFRRPLRSPRRLALGCSP